jgi:D-glycero-D-manno-heptose 1,7-bisphosphate phosphatase
MASLAASQPALFLDRDGVIIDNRSNYVRSWDDVDIYPEVLQQLAAMAHLPLRVVIVTNQSAVGRRLISLQVAQEINERLVGIIERAGGHIDGVYMCPHAPWHDCDCRKPRPGMLLQAAADLALDLNRSLLVGDALTDLQAAVAAGVPQRILVRTGRGRRQEQSAAKQARFPFATYDSLSQALAQQDWARQLKRP